MTKTDDPSNGLVEHQDELQANNIQQLANKTFKSATIYAECLTELSCEQPNIENLFPPIITDAKIRVNKFHILQLCERLRKLFLGLMEWLMHQKHGFHRSFMHRNRTLDESLRSD